MKFLDKDVMNKIGALEHLYAVDKIALGDTTKIWNLVRVVLGMYVLNPHYVENENKNKMKKMIFLVKEKISRKTLPTTKICAFSDADAQRMKDGYYYDIYVDPLSEIFKSYIVLDWASAKAKRNKTLENHIPLKIPTAVLLEKVLPSKTGIYYSNILEDIVKDFAGTFNLDKEKLMKHVLESISIFKIVKKDIRKKLEKINPSTVIIRGAYGRFQMGVTQACHELGIPAVEIQHGLIYEESFPYIKRTKSENYDCIPDTLLTWGEFFSDIVKKGYSFKRNKVISVGFPYLEKMVTNEYSKDSKLDEFRKRFKTVILVAGQSLESIDDFVRNAAEKNTDVGYIYKPHPRDERDITFSQNNVVVVERCIDIYSLFQYVDFTFSSSSTIMFESLAFGIPSVCTSVDIDIRHTGIIDNEAIYLIDTADEFLGVVSKVKENRVMIRKNAERFFKRNALSNIKEIIK